MSNNKKNNEWSESFFTKTLLALLTLMTAVLNMVIAAIKLIEGQSLWAILAILGFICFAVVSVVFFSLRNVQKNYGIRTKQDYELFINKISNVTHNLLHRVRNSIYYMEEAYENKQFEAVEDFEQYVTIEFLQLMDSLANSLSNILGTDIRACIKCLKYTATNEEDIKKMNLVTFARSGLKNIDEIMQEHAQPIPIEENSDFSDIVDKQNNNRQRQYFYEKNLREYDRRLREQGRKYKNSNESWESDYITTIVCPIRLKTRAGSLNSAMLKYDLIGFLCVDSLDENAFCGECSDFCLDLLKGMADIMYVYLARFNEFYYSIKGEIENNV